MYIEKSYKNLSALLAHLRCLIMYLYDNNSNPSSSFAKVCTQFYTLITQRTDRSSSKFETTILPKKEYRSREKNIMGNTFQKVNIELKLNNLNQPDQYFQKKAYTSRKVYLENENNIDESDLDCNNIRTSYLLSKYDSKRY